MRISHGRLSAMRVMLLSASHSYAFQHPSDEGYLKRRRKARGLLSRTNNKLLHHFRISSPSLPIVIVSPWRKGWNKGGNRYWTIPDKSVSMGLNFVNSWENTSGTTTHVKEKKELIYLFYKKENALPVPDRLWSGISTKFSTDLPPSRSTLGD